MNILMVPSWYKTESNSISGSFFREQAMALTAQGHSVYVADATFQGKGDLNSPRLFRLRKYDDGALRTYSLVWPAFGITRMPSGGVPIFRHNLHRIFKKIQRDGIRIDLIQAHSFYPAGVAAVWLGEKYGIPTVVTEHLSTVLRKSLHPKRVEMLKKTVNGADRFVCVSHALKNAVVELTGTEKTVAVLPNSVIDSFCYVPKAQGQTFTFVSAGNFVPGKRFDLTLAAFARLYREDPTVRLKIAGDGPLRSRLETLTGTLNITDAVTFLGRVPREKMPALYQSSDAFVLPSDSETFGVVYIEALACGLPVIGTRNGGAEEIITAENGLLVKLNDADGLYKAMAQLRQDCGKWDPAKLSADCLAQYGEAAVAARTLEGYRSILMD